MNKQILVVPLLILTTQLAYSTPNTDIDGCSVDEQRKGVADMVSMYKMCSYFLPQQKLAQLENNISIAKAADQKRCNVTPQQQTPTNSDFEKNDAYKIYQKLKSMADKNNGTLPPPSNGNRNLLRDDCEKYATHTQSVVDKSLQQQNPINTDAQRYQANQYDPTESGKYCAVLNSVMNQIQKNYKWAYHGQQSLSDAEYSVNAQISDFADAPRVVRFLFSESYKAKTDIFQGHDSNDELIKFSNQFFSSCKANYNNLKMGDPQDRLIDYSKQR